MVAAANREVVKHLLKMYFPEAADKQVDALLKELVQEIEVFTHAKIREAVNQQRMKSVY
jgi:hypothetical protein